MAARGAILAHSARAGDRVFRKGRVLSQDDIEALAASGHGEVTAARLEDGDVAEDIAAGRIAAAMAGREIRVGAAFTGRANLYATARGLAMLDAQRIAAVNGVHEAVTVATLPSYTPVEPRQMIATIKIIPFAAPAGAVAEAERILAGSPAIAIAPFVAKQAALISTHLPETRVQLLDKNRTALDRRLQALGSAIVHEARVPHRTDALADAIGIAHEAGADPILIFGASAITDRRDVVPAAIVAAGGMVEHFGMPVDPGNLLLLASLGSTKVVGLPSCARSPKTNGFDFILQRLAAEISVGPSDFAAMGIGGLLSEIHTRPQPREGRRQTGASHAPKIAAVILAAGLSSRMGRNKLVAEVDGKPLVRHVAEAALASGAHPVVVVTGSDATALETALAGVAVTTVRNPDFQKGLSASLICGLNAVPDDCNGAVVLLGDMPGISAPVIDKLIAAFSPEEDRAICVATFEGKRGNPVLWSRQFFADIRKLEGDVGARALILENADLVCEVEADDESPLLDIDTPAALAAYQGRRR